MKYLLAVILAFSSMSFACDTVEVDECELSSLKSCDCNCKPVKLVEGKEIWVKGSLCPKGHHSRGTAVNKDKEVVSACHEDKIEGGCTDCCGGSCPAPVK